MRGLLVVRFQNGKKDPASSKVRLIIDKKKKPNLATLRDQEGLSAGHPHTSFSPRGLVVRITTILDETVSKTSLAVLA